MQDTRLRRRENARIYRDFSSHEQCRVIFIAKSYIHRTARRVGGDRAGSRKSSAQLFGRNAEPMDGRSTTIAMLDKERKSVMTSIDDTLSEIRWLRNEIWRCRRLLNTGLPGAERKALEKRLLEQVSAFEGLLSTAFPLALSSKVYSVKSTAIGQSDSPEAVVENAPTHQASPSGSRSAANKRVS